jgi:hypothetical protein
MIIKLEDALFLERKESILPREDSKRDVKNEVWNSEGEECGKGVNGTRREN